MHPATVTPTAPRPAGAPLAIAPRALTIASLYSTPGALRALEAIHGDEGAYDVLHGAVTRFLACDWGALTPGDADLNNRATWDGSRIIAAYPLDPGDGRDGDEGRPVFWFIADATEDEENTQQPRRCMVMLPGEY